MVSSLRTVSMALPRISMARIPLVAFVNTHVTHANSAHSSGYSSMSKKSPTSPSSSSSSPNSWSNAAKKAAEKLEHSAKSMAGSQDHIREVKQYDNPEDEVMMNLGLAMSCNNHHQDAPQDGTRKQQQQQQQQQHRPPHHRGKATATAPPGTFSQGSTFEQSLVSQVQADVLHPSVKNKEHEQELVSTLSQQLKTERSSTSNMSQHASDAIRMVESHNVLKQDNAPIHSLSGGDHSTKSSPSPRSHKTK